MKSWLIEKRSCCWSIPWLNVYLAMLFYLVHVILYFFATKINLSISIPYPNQVYDKERKKNISQCGLCVLYNAMLWNSPFPGFCLYQKKFSCHQPWRWTLLNTNLITQFWEKVNSFNFLANTLFQNMYQWLCLWLPI